MTEDQYAELAQFWHEYMVLGPRREDRGLDRTGRALAFCQWIDSDPDEDPVYGLPDILAFFDEKERREGTAPDGWSELIDHVELSATQEADIREPGVIWIHDNGTFQDIKLDAKAASKLYDFIALHLDRIHRQELIQEASQAQESQDTQHYMEHHYQSSE